VQWGDGRTGEWINRATCWPSGNPAIATDPNGQATDLLAQSIMTDEAAAASFSSWLRKWDSEKSWHGFVYATVKLGRPGLRTPEAGAESCRRLRTCGPEDGETHPELRGGRSGVFWITYRFAGAMDIAIAMSLERGGDCDASPRSIRATREYRRRSARPGTRRTGAPPTSRCSPSGSATPIRHRF
jgi:hypothetical protein